MSLAVVSLGGKSMHVGQSCAQCGSDTRCRRREFSEQAWSVLLVWNEIEKSTVDAQICDDCYEDLRDILIDRADEIAAAASMPIPAAGAGGTKKKAAAAPAKKTGRATATASKPKTAAGKKRSSRVA